MHCKEHGPWYAAGKCAVCLSIEKQATIDDALEIVDHHLDGIVISDAARCILAEVHQALDPQPPEPRGCPQCGSTDARDGKCQSCGYHDGMLSMPGGDRL